MPQNRVYLKELEFLVDTIRTHEMKSQYLKTGDNCQRCHTHRATVREDIFNVKALAGCASGGGGRKTARDVKGSTRRPSVEATPGCEEVERPAAATVPAHQRLRNYNVREVTIRKDSSTIVGNIYARHFARPDISLIDDAKYQVFIVTE